MPKQILRAYVDDSGEKEFGEKTSRYFVYAATIVDLADEARVNTELSALKVATFGTGDVELKSNWLRRPEERRRRYLDPFGLSEDALRQFVESLYALDRQVAAHVCGCGC